MGTAPAHSALPPPLVVVLDPVELDALVEPDAPVGLLPPLPSTTTLPPQPVTPSPRAAINETRRDIRDRARVIISYLLAASVHRNPRVSPSTMRRSSADTPQR